MYSFIKGFLCIVFIGSFLLSCAKEERPDSIHTKPVKVAEYLFEISYSDYDPERSECYGRSIDNYSMGGACSVIRKDGLVSRNYDFLYSKMPEFIIRVCAAEGRYASIGVTGSMFELTPDFVESNPYGRYADILPYLTVDGINEMGVFCSINMVEDDEEYFTSGTYPDAPTTLYSSQLVRYVLDHCASAYQACKELEQINIEFSNILGEFHFMIADKEETYVVEFFDNKLVFSKPKENILTNFYVLSDKFLKNNEFGLRSMGTERYQLASQNYDRFATEEGCVSMMKNLAYSHIYDLSSTPYFYSEYYGDVYKGVVIDANTPKDFYRSFLESECDVFKKSRRDYLDDLWITTHTSIYDLEHLSLKVFSQENFEQAFEYSL